MAKPGTPVVAADTVAAMNANTTTSAYANMLRSVKFHQKRKRREERNELDADDPSEMRGVSYVLRKIQEFDTPERICSPKTICIASKRIYKTGSVL